ALLGGVRVRLAVALGRGRRSLPGRAVGSLLGRRPVRRRRGVGPVRGLLRGRGVRGGARGGLRVALRRRARPLRPVRVELVRVLRCRGRLRHGAPPRRRRESFVRVGGGRRPPDAPGLHSTFTSILPGSAHIGKTARRVNSGPARLGTLSYPGTVPLTTTTTGDPTGAGPVATRPAGAARPVVLGADEWAERERAHAERADAFTAGWRARKPRREKHAIEDFLFTYYPTRPAQLRRWHPGPGVVLAPPAGRADAGSPDDAPDPYATRAGWRWYRETREGVTLDADAFLADRGDTVRYLRALLAATASRPGRFGCFGLHEWAMVYRDKEAGRDHRHPLPLRLGHEGTDRVVESHPVQCSHFDAFRFFTP